MASRTDLNTYEDAYFNFLFKIAYPDADVTVFTWIKENMIPNGDVSTESLLETAIAKSNGIKKVSSEGYDFHCKDGKPGGDAKKATAFLNPNRPRREAVIKQFHNKVGDLYVCVYEPLTEKFYFFRVPPRIYKGRKTLAVYFEQDGKPRRKQLRYDADRPLWDCEVSDINSLYDGKIKLLTEKKLNELALYI
jgi:hypothetical protein